MQLPVIPALAAPGAPVADDTILIIPRGYIFPRDQQVGPCPLGAVDTGYLVYIMINRRTRRVIVKHFVDLDMDFNDPLQIARLNAWRRAVVRASPTGADVRDGVTFVFVSTS